MTWDTRRNLRLSPELLVGGYVDGRQGAVLVCRNELVHLDAVRTRHLAEYLLACLEQKQAAS